MLHLKNAVLGYDKSRVLRGVTLTIEPGECIGLIGPNGGGKSTLLRTMAGLLPPLKGDVSFKELSMGSWKRKELARHIAYLPQNCPVPFAYRALDVVLLDNTRTCHGGAGAEKMKHGPGSALPS